jgi:hypothetical protein
MCPTNCCVLVIALKTKKHTGVLDFIGGISVFPSILHNCWISVFPHVASLQVCM